MARLELELDGSGISRNADASKKNLDRIKTSATQAETAVDRLGDRGAADMARLTAATNRAAAAQAKMNTSSGRLGSVFNRNRGAIQNTAFQVQDLAVQISSGTAASTAFAQQLPQLLGGFGALGAIAGAAVGVLVPLAANLLFAGEAAADVGDAFDDAASSISSARRIVSATADDLVERYGNVSVAVIELQEALSGLALQEQASAIESLIDAVSGAEVIDQTTNALSRFEQQSGRNRRTAQGLIESLGLTTDGARALRDAIEGLQSATGLEEQAEAARTARLALEDLDASSLSGVIGELTRLEDRAREALGNVAEAAANVRSTLSAGQLTQGQIGGGRGGDPRDFDFNANQAVQNRTLTLESAFAPSRSTRVSTSRSGGTAGGRSPSAEIDKQARSLERLRSQLDPAFAAQLRFNQATETLNQALESGNISQDERNRLLEVARDRMEQAARATDGLARLDEALEKFQDFDNQVFIAGQALQSSLSDFLFDPFETGVRGMINSFSQALRRMAADAVAARISQSIFGLADNPSAGTFLGQLFKDAGGRIPSGQTAIVGERRPEIVNGTLVNSPMSIQGPARIVGGAQTARSGTEMPSINQKTVIALSTSDIAAAISSDPGFRTSVVEVGIREGWSR